GTLPRRVTTASSVSTVTAVDFTRFSARSRTFVFDVSHESLISSAATTLGIHASTAIAMQIEKRFMASLLSSAPAVARLFGLLHPLGPLDLVAPLHLLGPLSALHPSHALLRALDVGPHAAKPETEVLSDPAPAVAGTALGEDLIEGLLLGEGLVPLHQLLGQGQRHGRLTQADLAAAKIRDDRRIDLEFLCDGLG